MKVIVFGSNGKVGRLVVDELLKRGHSVTAFVHGTYHFPRNSHLRVIKGDIYEALSIEEAMIGNDAVVSTLGSWGTKKKNVLAEGMRNIIPVMQEQHVSRIVSLTGADCDAPGDTQKFVHNLSHALFSVFAPKILKDGEAHLDQLISSELDWSVVRSPVMNNEGDPEAYQLGKHRPQPWETIHRKSVAKAMVDVLESNNYTQQAPFITRS